MQLVGKPKAQLRSEAHDFINLYASLGERAENFLPDHVLDILKNFVDLCYQEPDDVARQKALVDKGLLELKDAIPGYVDVALMLYPTLNSKAYEYSARRQVFIQKLTSLIDTDAISEETKKHARNILKAHDFSLGNPPVTKDEVDFLYRVFLGENVGELRKFREVLGITDDVEEAQWNYMLDVLDQMVVQSTHYTTKAEVKSFLTRNESTINFKGLKGFIRTLVAGTADTAVNLLAGDVFHKDAVRVIEFSDAENLYDQVKNDAVSIFVVKVQKMRKNIFNESRWFPLLTRLVIVDDSDESRSTNTSLVFAFHNLIINTLDKVHTKKLGAHANSQMNLRLILDKVHGKNLVKFRDLINNRIAMYDEELKTFRHEQLGETGNNKKDITLFKFDEFARQVIKDRYTLSRLRDYIDLVIDVKENDRRKKRNQELIDEFEARMLSYFYSNNENVHIATIVEGGGRNQLRIYGQYLLARTLKPVPQETVEKCLTIIDIIPHNLKRTLHNHFHKNFGINLFLERYKEYMTKVDNEADNKGRFQNFLIDLGIFEDYKRRSEKEQNTIKEFLGNLGNTPRLSIADDAQMIIRDILSPGRILRPYIIWNQQQSWEYKDLFPSDSFDINPFDIDVELDEEGRIDYARLQHKLTRIKYTFQLFDETGNLWDRFCDNLTIVINDPHNPSGYTDFNSVDLINFLKFVSRSKITLLLDEAYNDAVKSEDPDEPKWRTISRYVFNNMANFPKISIVSSVSTTKNLAATGNRLGAIIASPKKEEMIKFAKERNKKDKANTNSLYMLVNVLEMAESAKKLKDELEADLPQNASRSHVRRSIEKFIEDELKNNGKTVKGKSKRSLMFEGSPLHIFLLEELVALDKLDILQMPDDFKYKGEPFFSYYKEDLQKKLNRFRINRIFRAETLKRLKTAKETITNMLKNKNIDWATVVDSDGSYLLNMKLKDYFSYQDLEKFTMKLAEQRGIAVVPYETGMLRFSVGGYIEGNEKSYGTFRKDMENGIDIFLRYWKQLYDAKKDPANKGLRTEDLLDRMFSSPSDKELMKTLIADFHTIKDLDKTPLEYLRISNIKTIYGASPKDCGVNINAITGSKNAVFEFYDNIGICTNVIEFVESPAFSKIYENLLPQIQKKIPLIKDLDIHEVIARYGKPAILKYVTSKLNFQPYSYILDNPEELNIMREILIELEDILFSDAKTKILALSASEDKRSDRARLEGVNQILRKHIAELLLHFNLPFAHESAEPTYEQLMFKACEQFNEIIGKSVENIDIKVLVNDLSDNLTLSEQFKSLPIAAKAQGLIAQLLHETFVTAHTSAEEKMLQGFLFKRDRTLRAALLEKLSQYQEKLNQYADNAELYSITEGVLLSMAPADLRTVCREVLTQRAAKVTEADLYENTRRIALFLIDLMNRTKNTEYFTRYNHTLIRLTEVAFKRQNSNINEMVQHGITVYKEENGLDLSSSPLETYENGNLKWLADMMKKCGVISTEQTVQTHTRISTDAKKREFAMYRVDREDAASAEQEQTDGSPYDYIKQLNTLPSSDFFINRLRQFAQNIDAEDYRCKVFNQGLFKEMYIIQKTYLKYLTDNYRILSPEDVSLDQIQNFVPDVLMILGAPEKVMSFPQIGFFDIKGPNGNIKTIMTPLRKEADYFGNVKKPRLTLINEKAKEMGGEPIHGSLFAVEEEDGSIFVVQISGDSGVGKSEMLAAMMLKWMQKNLPGVRSIKLIAGDMYHVFADTEGNLYGVGTEVGDFSRVTDFDPDFIKSYNSLFESSADSNVDDPNSRSTISGLCDIVMPFKIDIMLTAYNYAKMEAGVVKYDNPENFLLYRDAHGERKEKATSQDGPNFQRTLMRFTADKNVVDVLDNYGNYLDDVLDWEWDNTKGKHYLASSYKLVDKIDIEDVVNKLFASKTLTHNNQKVTVQSVYFDIIKNRFVATLADANGNTQEAAIDRTIFATVFDSIASTPSGQPFVDEQGQNESKGYVVNLLKGGRDGKAKAKHIQLGILSTDIGKKGKEITGPQKAAEDVKKLIQDVRISRKDINEQKQYVKDTLNHCYPHIFDDNTKHNGEVWRYNFYLYQLENMRKADFVRLDNPDVPVDLSMAFKFGKIDKKHVFSPLLVTDNINTELTAFTETYKQLMSLPHNEEFANEFYDLSDKVYVAKGYSRQTIINNIMIQLLLLNKSIHLYDLTRGRITEKVNRETLAAVRYAAERRYNEVAGK